MRAISSIERSLAEPGRIPPFRRNEFGFTLGGPVTLPGIYRGRDRTFFFGQYQGFRQVLGTTQVLSVPTQAERQGVDTTAFPGDTLYVPVNPQVAPILAAYPMPNDPQGSFGPRTYATSSKVSTDTNQFSLRIDHRISDQGQLFARFNLDNTTGPLTNPDQSAIDPSFAISFHDHQRNAGAELHAHRIAALHFRDLARLHSQHAALSFSQSHPARHDVRRQSLRAFQLGFRDRDGRFTETSFSSGRTFIYVRGTHTLKFGAEMRFNRDTRRLCSEP